MGNLHLTWGGADWDVDGDLFIYLGTSTEGETDTIPIYNPYETTRDNTFISLSAGDLYGPLGYGLWIEDSETATWLAWEGEQWVEKGQTGFEYRLTHEEGTHFTDIIIPFSSIGLAYNTASLDEPGWLDIIGFASAEDALRLWATIPAENGLNSTAAIPFAPSEDEPSQMALLATSVSSPYDLQESNGGCLLNIADISYQTSTSLGGIDYNDTEDVLKTFLPEYSEAYLPAPANYTNWLENTYCVANPDERVCADRDLSNDELLTQLSLIREIGNRPVLPNEPFTYTVAFRNESADAFSDLFENWNRYWAFPQSAVLADGCNAVSFEVQPLEIGEFSFRATAPANGLTQNDLIIAHYDDTTQTGSECQRSIKSADELGFITRTLSMRHLADTGGPTLTIDQPRTVVGAGEAQFYGTLSDQFTISNVVLEAQGAGGTVTKNCPDDTPTDGEWSCTWDMAEANGGSAPADGASINVRASATDALNQATTTEWLTLQVDTSPSVISLTAQLQTATRMARQGDGIPTLSGGNAVINGNLGDNRTVAQVELCDTETNVCNLATIATDQSLDSAKTHSYADATEQVIADNSCGAPLVRSFSVTDSFKVGRIELGLNVTHDFRPDVQVKLTSPAGKTVNVMNIPEPGFIANADILFSPNATQRIQDDFIGHDVSEPYYQNLRLSTESLAQFDGEAASGSWTLSVCDKLEAHSGTYHRAELRLIEDVVASNTTAHWAYTIPDAETDDSRVRTFTVYAIDEVGNRSAGQTLSYRVDNVPPTITATQQISSVALPEASTDLTASVTDTVSYPTMVSGTVKDGGTVASVFAAVTNPYGQVTSEPIVETNGEWVFSFTPLFAGDYTITINASDQAGNTSSVGAYTVTATVADVYDTYLPLINR